jgi:hypothetical protein
MWAAVTDVEQNGDASCRRLPRFHHEMIAALNFNFGHRLSIVIFEIE